MQKAQKGEGHAQEGQRSEGAGKEGDSDMLGLWHKHECMRVRSCFIVVVSGSIIAGYCIENMHCSTSVLRLGGIFPDTIVRHVAGLPALATIPT